MIQSARLNKKETPKSLVVIRFCIVFSISFIITITEILSQASDSPNNISDSTKVNESPAVIHNSRGDSAVKTDLGPGAYSPEQDSAFKRALEYSLPVNALIRNGLHLSEPIWEFEQRMMGDRQFSIAAKHLNSLPKSYYLPTPVEMVQRQIMIENAFNVPFVKTYNPYGLQVNLNDIGLFLGVTEDVSPRISYTLEYTSEVEIVIYSVKAAVIATIFKGIQGPGKYNITWNGRDDLGKQMSSGDYVAEVRIGKEKFIRKRIVIP